MTAQYSFYDILYRLINSCSTSWQVNVPLCQALRWEQITQDPEFSRQNSCTFGLIYQGVVEGERARKVLNAQGLHTSPHTQQCCPLQVPLDPLVFVGGAVGNARKKLRLVETHMKLIPKWAKGVSFLQEDSGQRLTEGEGKPTGDGAKELWLGNSGRFYSSRNTLVGWPIGMSVCNSWRGARGGQFHLQCGF